MSLCVFKRVYTSESAVYSKDLSGQQRAAPSLNTADHCYMVLSACHLMVVKIK